jgi:RNA polymerase sigma factor (sigma-70 family)
MEAYEQISQFDARKASFRTWIIGRTLYRAIDRRRHLQSTGFYRSLPIAAAATQNIDSSDQLPRFSRDELKHLLAELLSILSPSEREVIELHLFRNLTLEETHTAIKTPLSMVRYMYYGAMKKLRTAFLAKVRKADANGSDPQPRKAGGHASS